MSVELPNTDQTVGTPLSPSGYRLSRAPEPGLALCLSGGGYRAMLFHVGVLWRLNELGLLGKLDRISSVSGGSITAGYLAVQWEALRLDSTPSASVGDFKKLFVDPIRTLAARTIDIKSVLSSIFSSKSVSQKVAGAYDELFDGKTLQDLPPAPRFVINATNVQTGALFRFSRPYLADWRIGEIRNPTLPLSLAVAASSAFPPVLSPMVIDFDPSQFTDLPGGDLQQDAFRKRVVLTDGGVYDNLGLETAWKRYDTLFVSDAGQNMKPDSDPAQDWGRHVLRVLDLVDNQVRAMRKRQVNQSFELYDRFHGSIASAQKGLLDLAGRRGAFWSIRDDLSKEHQATGVLHCPADKTAALAATPTRLAALPVAKQEQLINWGYAVCDAAVRRHYDPTLPQQPAFPYDGGVG